MLELMCNFLFYKMHRFLITLFHFKDGHENMGAGSAAKSSVKAILENLGELWDQQQYDTEYNLDNFMHSLK